MKKLCILISCASLFLVCCATNKPILLDSPLHNQCTPTINPSLSTPEGGPHPYIGVSGGLSHDSSSTFLLDDASFTSKNIGLNAGLLFQPSLLADNAFGGFVALNARGVFSYCTISPNYELRNSLTSEEIQNLTAQKNSFSYEMAVRFGAIGKLKIVTLAMYANLFADFEKGDYYDYRKKIDGTGNFYNIANNELSYGFDLGGDFAIGKTGGFDFGLIYEFQTTYNKTQSYKSAVINYDSGLFGDYQVFTVPGGIDTIIYQYKVEPYFDYRNVRVSCSFNFDNITLSTTCRL